MPLAKGVAKVPVVMQMEALECGAASHAEICTKTACRRKHRNCIRRSDLCHKFTARSDSAGIFAHFSWPATDRKTPKCIYKILNNFRAEKYESGFIPFARSATSFTAKP